MKKLFILFFAVVLYKLISNLFSLISLQRYEKEFTALLSGEPSKIDEHKLQTIALFKKAGIKDTQVPVSQPVGFGQVANFNASVFHNFPAPIALIALPASQMFRNAIGIYKTRMLESINPIYWISLIIFLPRNILSYIGMDLESSASKLLNVFLTFIWWIFCTLVTIFQPEIKSFIRALFT